MFVDVPNTWLNFGGLQPKQEHPPGIILPVSLQIASVFTLSCWHFLRDTCKVKAGPKGSESDRLAESQDPLLFAFDHGML